jgi:hypothetical protein
MTPSARWAIRNAIDFCVLVHVEDDHDKKFLALTASGIAALLIIFLVAARAELGKSALCKWHRQPVGSRQRSLHLAGLHLIVLFHRARGKVP